MCKEDRDEMQKLRDKIIELSAKVDVLIMVNQNSVTYIPVEMPKYPNPYATPWAQPMWTTKTTTDVKIEND